MGERASAADVEARRVLMRWIAHVVAPQLDGRERAHVEACAREHDRRAHAVARERERTGAR